MVFFQNTPFHPQGAAFSPSRHSFYCNPFTAITDIQDQGARNFFRDALLKLQTSGEEFIVAVAAFHGHAHAGTMEGAVGGTKVYNVAKPVLAKAGYHLPFFLFEV
ncbi:MAG: hypothetical protein JST42_07610 [Bacteroidetes bacterium]|nr:hypothetical protein [Bacteroidota bacterium]